MPNILVFDFTRWEVYVMYKWLAVVGIVGCLALFAVSSALAVYIVVFWFRADWYQVFLILVFSLTALASWNALGMVASWGTDNAK